MKNITRILPALLLAATIAGCQKSSDRLFPYGWTPVSHEYDSLTLRAEHLYILRDSVPEIEATVRRMRGMADSDKENKLMDSRTTYWEGRLGITTGNFDKGYSTMEKALEMTDSAEYPYDYNRIKWNLDLDYHEPTVERYESLVRDLDFFRESGDLVISGGLAMELGCFLDDLGATDEGIPYLNMADSLFTEAGMTDQVADNRINHANALRIKGDTIAAIKCLEDMLSDTVMPMSPFVRDIVTGNLYVLNNDTAMLREAYDIVTSHEHFTDLREHQEAIFMYATFLAEESVINGDLARAMHYDSVATSIFPEIQDPNLINDYYDCRYQLFDKEGKIDSAYRYLALAATLNDSILTSDNRADANAAALAGRIKTMEVQADLEHRNSVFSFVVICLVMLLLLLGASVYFWRRTQNQRLREIKSRLEIEQSNRKILAMELLIKEKDTLFSTMEQEMSQLSESGEISRQAAGKIESSLKAHNGMKAHRDNFQETFDKVHPQFRARLSESYPNLTDTDLRFAAYITLGLESKHLASVLGIRPESVKQARWRLRSKMGLDKEMSLEDTLRKFSE